MPMPCQSACTPVKKQAFSLLLALLLIANVACDGANTSGMTPPDDDNEPPVDTTGTGIANVIPTMTVDPQPVTLRVEDMPAPYHSSSVAKPPQVGAVPASPLLHVPEGFVVNLYAEGLSSPRWLTQTPDGAVVVSESGSDRLRLLRDTNGDGAADVRATFGNAANGLNRPFGMAFVDGAFYVANTGALDRFAYAEGQQALQGSGTQVATFPTGGHWTRSLIASPDGQHLYVGVGSASNVNPEEAPRATVQVMRPDGSEQLTFASGLRNPVGLAFHPSTGVLYTVVNERDRLGDDLVPDYLAGVVEGAFYGWPYAYLTPDHLDPRRMTAGASERPDLAAQTRTPEVLFQSHSAPLGLVFYTGEAFPQKYRGGAFVAFHGSWNRDTGTGYKLVFVPFGPDGQPEGGYEDFLTGFLTNANGPSVWGRPTGLLVLADGSLLFTDDAQGRIYRISYPGA